MKGNKSTVLQTSPNHVWLTSRDRSSPWNSWCPIFPHSSGQHTSPCWRSVGLVCNSILWIFEVFPSSVSCFDTWSRILTPIFPGKMSLTPSTEFLRCFPSFLRQSDQSWPCYVVDTLWQQRANVVLGTQLGQVLPLSPSSNQWFLISRQWIHWSSFLPTSFPYKVFVMVDIISRDSRALADCRHRWCQTSAKGIFQIHLIPVIDEALNAVKRVF